MSNLTPSQRWVIGLIVAAILMVAGTVLAVYIASRMLGA